MPLSFFFRILAASALRRAASAADDAVAASALRVLRGLDRGVIGARSRLYVTVASVTAGALDAALRVSGLVSGCGCSDDAAEGCTRDGQRLRCGCGCHTATEAVL